MTNIFNLSYKREEPYKLVSQLSDLFIQSLSARNLIQIPPVAISSGIDSSVRLVGSHISVLKPHFLQKDLEESGLFIVQDCIRTQNLRDLYNSKAIEYGSHFRSLGAVVPYEKLGFLIKSLYEFLVQVLEIPLSYIKVRINSNDKDLLRYSRRYFSAENLQIDTQKPSQYKHTMGVPGIEGRNINVALENTKTQDLVDVGNIIIWDKNHQNLIVELSLGTTNMLRQIFGLNHVYDFYPLHLTANSDYPAIARKLEDSIIVSCSLFSEEIEPGSANNVRRILKDYLKAISYFRAVLKISIKELFEIIRGYLKKMKLKISISQKIISFVVLYEKNLLEGKLLSKNDKTILVAIKKLNSKSSEGL